MSAVVCCRGRSASATADASAWARYPTELIDVWRSLDGERMTLRPILSQDQPGLRALFGRSSRAARFQRFRVAAGEFPPHVLAAMCELDFARHLAVVITVDRSGDERIVADARYCVGEGGASAEFALLVEDGWQRRGLGRRALDALVDAAQRSGLQALHASVMRTNAAMLLLLHRCGFSAAQDADGGFVRMARNVSVAGEPRRRMGKSCAPYGQTCRGNEAEADLTCPGD